MSGFDNSGGFGAYRTLSQDDLWRLSDELSVVDAAILITGNDPAKEMKLRDDDSGVVWGQKTDYEGYAPTFKALKAAILGNKLRANVKHSMRGQITERDEGNYEYEIVEMPHEETVSYDMLINQRSKSGYHDQNYTATTWLNFSASDLQTGSSGSLYVCKEPNWSETMIGVDDLKSWLESRNIFPPFFFPVSPAEGFRDKNHPRYSAKLATAVAAWEEVEHAAPNMSVKQTLDAWIQSNGRKYGLGSDGLVSSGMAKDLATIPNWDTNGGATPTRASTSLPPVSPEEPVQNYKYSHGADADGENSIDPEIPF